MVDPFEIYSEYYSESPRLPTSSSYTEDLTDYLRKSLVDIPELRKSINLNKAATSEKAFEALYIIGPDPGDINGLEVLDQNSMMVRPKVLYEYPERRFPNNYTQIFS